MKYISYYNSPLGKILLASDEIGLFGAWFENQKYYADIDLGDAFSEENDTLNKAKKWLDNYFQKQQNNIDIPLHIIGTEFQKEVWKFLLAIPYGETTTYGKIAEEIAENRGIEKMSSRAVGHAVGRNHLSIFIPCHRVVGSNNKLTGYASGIERKEYLLKIEKNILINVNTNKKYI